MTLNSETLSKITQPGLWFVKSRQPLLNISSLIYRFVIDGCMSFTIYTTQEEILKNEVMHRFFNDQKKDYLDDIWLDHELSEYSDFETIHTCYDFIDNFNFFWESYIYIKNNFSDCGWCSNSCFNPTLIDYSSILCKEEESLLAEDLINDEHWMLETGSSVIVFLPEKETSFSLDFINNHILNL